MRPGYALALVLGGSAALFGLVFDPAETLIWNRTGSAPKGLYWLSGDPFTKGRWVAARPGALMRTGPKREGMLARIGSF